MANLRSVRRTISSGSGGGSWSFVEERKEKLPQPRPAIGGRSAVEPSPIIPGQHSPCLVAEPANAAMRLAKVLLQCSGVWKFISLCRAFKEADKLKGRYFSTVKLGVGQRIGEASVVELMEPPDKILLLTEPFDVAHIRHLQRSLLDAFSVRLKRRYGSVQFHCGHPNQKGILSSIPPGCLARQPRSIPKCCQRKYRRPSWPVEPLRQIGEVRPPIRRRLKTRHVRCSPERRSFRWLSLSSISHATGEDRSEKGGA